MTFDDIVISHLVLSTQKQESSLKVGLKHMSETTPVPRLPKNTQSFTGRIAINRVESVTPWLLSTGDDGGVIKVSLKFTLVP